jgi:hypothetical protein
MRAITDWQRHVLRDFFLALLMVDQCSVISDQWSVISGQWSVVKARDDLITDH